MQNTNIQWTDHTVNFWWGCTKVSRACKHCYAESVAKVFGKRLFGTVPQWGAGKPRFERLEKARAEALKIQRSAERRAKGGESEVRRPRVFVNSMSDWLDDEVPLEWLAYLLETLHLCPNVDFQLLTKRPENWRDRVTACMGHLDGAAHDYLRDWLKYGTAPDNLWIGTTVEDQKAANTRIPHLLKIPAEVRFLSCEPLVGAIDLRIPQLRGAMDDPRFGGNFKDFNEALHWIIAGGESGGPAVPMHPDWVRSLRDQCAAAQVAFFFKQWGEWLPQAQAAALPAPARAYKGHRFDDGTLMLRVGVQDAGRMLDGVQHHAFPA